MYDSYLIRIFVWGVCLYVCVCRSWLALATKKNKYEPHVWCRNAPTLVSIKLSCRCIGFHFSKWSFVSRFFLIIFTVYILLSTSDFFIQLWSALLNPQVPSRFNTERLTIANWLENLFWIIPWCFSDNFQSSNKFDIRRYHTAR